MKPAQSGTPFSNIIKTQDWTVREPSVTVKPEVTTIHFKDIGLILSRNGP